MKISELSEGVGRIVKGVNTTVDVGPNQTSIEAAKFGNKVDKDGRPPVMRKNIKGSNTNVLFNLGMAESSELRYTAREWAIMEGGHTLEEPQLKTPGRIMEALTSYPLIETLGKLGPNTKIYVDMDGVLADFFGEWAKAMGKDSFRDIEDPANAIKKIKTVDNFWLNLPMLPQARELLSIIKKVKGSYYICSSPLADDPRSEPHKREWVKKNLGFFLPEEVYITHNKPQFAKNNDGSPNILIDDYGVNINAWEDAGGIGFKYKDHKFERTAKAIKQAVGENFADGKKKGKSRPGRVKRSGASCKGSVTDLRKRAKKYSGERGRMYHWCANMKGGKKK
jgi:5'(3')-deoxyribonucleotidase